MQGLRPAEVFGTRCHQKAQHRSSTIASGQASRLAQPASALRPKLCSSSKSSGAGLLSTSDQLPGFARARTRQGVTTVVEALDQSTNASTSTIDGYTTDEEPFSPSMQTKWVGVWGFSRQVSDFHGDICCGHEASNAASSQLHCLLNPARCLDCLCLYAPRQVKDMDLEKLYDSSELSGLLMEMGIKYDPDRLAEVLSSKWPQVCTISSSKHGMDTLRIETVGVMEDTPCTVHVLLIRPERTHLRMPL